MYQFYHSLTGGIIVVYFQGHLICSKPLKFLPISIAFDAELASIYKALVLVNTKLSNHNASHKLPFIKVLLYIDSLSSLALFSKNSSNFLYHLYFVKIYNLINSLLTIYPYLFIKLLQCPTHKSVIRNEKVDLIARQAALLLFPESGVISLAFILFIFSKNLLDDFLYYQESYKNKPGAYSPRYTAYLNLSNKVKAHLKELFNNYLICFYVVHIAT